jgi:3',5'-cyclic AMP phosphodiesterase CpdA
VILPSRENRRCRAGHVVVAMGNHDVCNVGCRHSEDFFGGRDSVKTVPCSEVARR